MNFIVIFFVSLICIALELLFTRLLNFKTWNHVVYTVIPFAILGYGIGANIVLMRKDAYFKLDAKPILGRLLVTLSVLIVLVSCGLIFLPIKIADLLNIFKSLHSIGTLGLAYTLFMLPFIVIGFTVVYLFRKKAADAHRLYAVDLVGASFGAIIFFFMIGKFGLFHSLMLLALLVFVVGGWLFIKDKNPLVFLGSAVFLLVAIIFVREPLNYRIDEGKGWEWIPDKLKADRYEQISARWHALGRTDIYRITDPHVRAIMAKQQLTFDLNVDPLPEFSYLTTNFLAGTPVFNFAALSDPKADYKIKLFSIIMEAPYLLLKERSPKVFVIGVGGGRDIFMARSHGASKIIGAEVNPEIVRAMSKGGEMYEYSGRIYDYAKVYALDARHVIKTLSPGEIDYIILNGADTFSGLSSGAYCYAESYLYTKEAIKDYLKALDDTGIVCFNRWLFYPPRETLRLEAIALEALEDWGVSAPWRHVIVGYGKDALGEKWSMTLIRKTAFSKGERKLVADYFRQNNGGILFPYPPLSDQVIAGNAFQSFDLYAWAFNQGETKSFARRYPYDISVVTDDKPFFYKYYKFHLRDLLWPEAVHHTGSVIFWTQFLVLLQSMIFIILFIFFPLWRFQKEGLFRSADVKIVPFVTYFACLGFGYMLIEVPLMQKFVLLLGSPIHSISVILAGLLFWTGVGSFLFPYIAKHSGGDTRSVISFTSLFVVMLVYAATFTSVVMEGAMAWSFAGRVALTVMLLAPAGLVLGFFFPAGLSLISTKNTSLISWAWGINCGFSVLASMLAIIMAQFVGFNLVLLSAGAVYLVAALAYRKLAAS